MNFDSEQVSTPVTPPTFANACFNAASSTRRSLSETDRVPFALDAQHAPPPAAVALHSALHSAPAGQFSAAPAERKAPMETRTAERTDKRSNFFMRTFNLSKFTRNQADLFSHPAPTGMVSHSRHPGANTVPMRAHRRIPISPRIRRSLFLATLLLLPCASSLAQDPNPPPTPEPGANADAVLHADALVFDSLVKDQSAPLGEFTLSFPFAFTNAASEPAVIHAVRTSCGCTVAKVPSLPWTIPPAGRGEFTVVLDAHGKSGTVTKTVWLNSSLGIKSLIVRAKIPEGQDSGPSGNEDRLRNMQISQADRFTIFRGECATCHARPAQGRFGTTLFLSACGICHAAQNRASMVPDLQRLGHPTHREHWLKWITFGRHGSLMPAFAQSEGGILSDAQIDSLADYLSRTIDPQRTPSPSRPSPAP